METQFPLKATNNIKVSCVSVRVCVKRASVVYFRGKKMLLKSEDQTKEFHNMQTSTDLCSVYLQNNNNN